ncbi:FHA domain-containing protein [Streptomyces sp. FIT100]|uniref:FHA domain-containing protein n=1 Tax=Streptomyces sp. FIT100 TaxID=2837956 RepID=UPI0021C7F82C|nr:FHA domain-containing protein [Streptomyces sp. FIT100]UUN27191.1 FHA domain-containing protein [Streptomyces sp. FIT100]
MQIRLTVLAPRSGLSTPARACDVLVTAPAGTALAAVSSALAAAVSGAEAAPGPVVLFAGRERLDAQRCALGEPPLVDGAVLSLQTPADDEAEDGEAGAQARLHVVAGPDAGGVHLLHGGQIRVGRAVEADVPLDDPDVSRLHCAVTVAEDGGVTVADLGSTNGTTLDGADVGPRPVRLPVGALLRIGESTLRLAPPAAPERLATTPDGEGHLRLGAASTDHARSDARDPDASDPHAPAPGAPGPDAPGPYEPRDDRATPRLPGQLPEIPGQRGPSWVRGDHDSTAQDGMHRHGRYTVRGATTHGLGGHTHGGPAGHGSDTTHSGTTHSGTTHGLGAYLPGDAAADGPGGGGAAGGPGAPDDGERASGDSPGRRSRKRGIGAWARRLAGARDAAGDAEHEWGEPSGAVTEPFAETWPDPAAVLLTALGPGPRLWERGPGHPEDLVVRLGTAERAGTSAVPVTVGLHEAGALGLAGPRERLTGLARSVVAQLAALHSPADLEIVLISADRARPVERRKDDWAWLGWLPHLRPAHGQDCRLLLAYDRDQAAARAAELTRRLDDGPLGPGWPSADRRTVEDAAARHTGPRTVLILDGDPGSAALREATARLASAGAAGGIHVVCLAETPAASPRSPVAATYEEACAASLAFRECGAVALLSGDVATALRLLRTAAGQPAGHGTVAALDAVSAAWAERFGRALAPLRTAVDGDGARSGPARGGVAAVASPLPRSARLLDELGLARATPASLMSRWASAPDGTAVLGAGPRGPLSVDLTGEGPHLLVEGPAGSGRTELLRAIAASLAAADRPDRLGLLLVDGAGGERGEGLAACTELPHVIGHLVASDPVRMREFAQALGAELKRRSELLGRESFAEWHARRTVADRLVGQRSAPSAESAFTAASPSASPSPSPSASARGDRADRGDVDSPESGSLRLRARAALAAGAATRHTASGAGGSMAGEAVASAPQRTRPAAPAADATEGHASPADPARQDPAAEAARAAEAAGAGGSTGRGSSAVPPGSSAVPRGSRPGTTGAAPAGPDGGPGPAGARTTTPATAAAGTGAPPPLARLVVLADDYDALVAPALGSPGRPAAGSVVRALEAVARDGERLGVHLVATSARPDRTEDTELARRARLRVVLDPPPVSPGPDDPAPGRGRLGHPDGRVTAFQGGRVTGRIPRTATLRPTVVEVEWERMGDPPTRRPVRELGNGPTDLALLASALDRAARSVGAAPLPPLPLHR